MYGSDSWPCLMWQLALFGVTCDSLAVVLSREQTAVTLGMAASVTATPAPETQNKEFYSIYLAQASISKLCACLK